MLKNRLQVNLQKYKQSLLLSKHGFVGLIIWPAQHSNTNSTNRVSLGRGYLFNPPMIDRRNVWETFKNIHYYFLLDELVQPKFTFKKPELQYTTEIVLIFKVQLMELGDHEILDLGFILVGGYRDLLKCSNLFKQSRYYWLALISYLNVMAQF